MEDILIGTLVPISICAVLPIMIVYLITRQKINNDKKRSEVLIKAIEANNNIDADKLAEAFGKQKKSPRELLYARLLRGCIYTLAGIGLGIIGLVSHAGGAEFGADPVFFPIAIGIVCLAIGIGYLAVYFASRNDKECTDKE